MSGGTAKERARKVKHLTDEARRDERALDETDLELAYDAGRKAGIEEAALASCDLCREGNPVEWYVSGDKRLTGFIHREPWGWCRADNVWKIHRRLAGKG